MFRSTRSSKLGAAVAGIAAWVMSAGPAPAGTHQDPKALAVVDAVERAIAPDNGWSKVGGLRFTFSVIKEGKTLSEVHHVWDLRTGQYRVDWASKDGDERIALFNVGAKGKQGDAYLRLGSKPKDAESTPADAARPATAAAEWTKLAPLLERKALETGYGRFINDTYWLLMPLKMKDPGVNLDYAGEKRVDGNLYDVVKLTFDHVGLTPGDTYWVYVNRESHLIDRWEYVLEGGQGREGRGGRRQGGGRRRQGSRADRLDLEAVEVFRPGQARDRQDDRGRHDLDRPEERRGCCPRCPRATSTPRSGRWRRIRTARPARRTRAEGVGAAIPAALGAS